MQSQEARRTLMAPEADKVQQPSQPPAEAVGTLFSALQQAESELASARAALERKTQELARVLAAQKEIEAELHQQRDWRDEIGRASCRERVSSPV